MRPTAERKGQMELLGLAVVVLLFSLGFIFALKLSGSSDIKDTFANDREVTARFLKTLLDTNDPECSDLTVEQLYVTCHIQDFSSMDSGYSCGATDICDRAQGVTEEVLRQTLGAWGRHYKMTITNSKAPIPDVELNINEGCTGDDEMDPSTMILPTRSGSISIMLAICREPV